MLFNECRHRFRVPYMVLYIYECSYPIFYSVYIMSIITIIYYLQLILRIFTIVHLYIVIYIFSMYILFCIYILCQLL